MPAAPGQARAADARADAPRIDTVAANAPRTGDTAAASPMVLDSPMAHGFKRTADGTVKGTEKVEHYVITPLAAHKRNKSMDAHSVSRIGEVRGRVLGYSLHGANAYAALRTTQNASQLRHGKSAKWVGEAVA
jgi:hypothetical protein